jgi:hypothetical protein
LLRYAATMAAVVQGEYGPGGPAMDALQPLIADEDPWVRAQTRLARTRMLGGGHAEADIEKALAEFRSIGERWGISYALATLADLAARRGDLALALDYSEQAVVVIAEMGNVEDLVLLRAKQAQLYWLVGDSGGSAAAMAQAEREAGKVGWPDAVAGMAFYKGDLARWAGDIATARSDMAHAEAMLRHTGVDPVFRAMVLDSLGHLDAAEGDMDSAGARREEALAIALGSGDDGLVSQVLVGVADQAVRHGFAYEAARLLAASEVVGGGPDLSRPDGAQVEAAARAPLGERGFAEAIKQARKEFADARRGGLATSAAVRELTTSALSS